MVLTCRSKKDAAPRNSEETTATVTRDPGFAIVCETHSTFSILSLTAVTAVVVNSKSVARLATVRTRDSHVGSTLMATRVGVP